MNISGCDEDICWHCSEPSSSCHCEFPAHRSKFICQASLAFCTSDGRDDRAHFDVGEPAFCAIDDFEGQEYGIVGPGRGSQHATTTPKNDEDGKTWESPDAFHPPESSSPVSFDAESSPFLTAGVEMPDCQRMSCREGGSAVNQRLCRSADDDPQSRVKMPGPTQEFFDARLCATGREHDEGHRMSAAHRSDSSASSKNTISSGPIILDLTISAQVELSLPCGSESESRAATTSRGETGSDYGTPFKTPPRDMSVDHASLPTQATMDNYLKRRCTSVDCFPVSKKAKLDRTVSDVSCTSDASIQTKYSATRPASLRRAESLTSGISAYSEQSTNSLFDPSPPGPPISGPFADEEYPPTIPSTPLPNSVDYARSRANPLARTLAVYRRRSAEVPVIPKVPVIAPPCLLLPTAVYCAGDLAIDRLEALLDRESSERARDGLGMYDWNRARRLREIYGTDLSLSRRDSGSTSDSSDDDDRWEEETTFSATESQESQGAASRPKIQHLAEQYRLANRGFWSNAYGIADGFRKEVTGWFCRKVPTKPIPLPGEPYGRPPGTDIYDQLMNSPQTRFHAAHMFHRYFRLPEKVEYWREAYKYEYWRSCDFSQYYCEVWDIAVACMALSVKLHRDCMAPLRPVFATEFLALAPQIISHATLELVQRDVLYSFLFQLGTCTPQDVLDELWDALPTLRKAAAPIGWAVVQRASWDKLFDSLLEPDMLQYPVTLLTAAALVDSLTFELALHFSTEAEGNECKCKASAQDRGPKPVLDEMESALWQIHLHEAGKLVNDVILDLQDVLHLTPVELDECRQWLSHVGRA